MARSRSYKAEGIVLRQTPLAEADRILTIYTRELGKVRAVARGVRRPKSKLGGHLEPLCHVAVSLAEGRNLDTVSEAEVIQSFSGLEDDLERLSKGIYLSELVDAFSPDRLANRQVFDLLLDALDRLQCSERPVNLLLSFETKLLGLSGYGPELRQCVECGLDLEAADHLFSSAAGVHLRGHDAGAARRDEGAQVSPARRPRGSRGPEHRVGCAGAGGTHPESLPPVCPGARAQERSLHGPGRAEPD